MSKNEVIKNSIWEIDRICKIAVRSKNMDEIRDLLDDLEEIRDMIMDREERLVIREEELLHKEMDKNDD